jgi:hypothetical protein
MTSTELSLIRERHSIDSNDDFQSILNPLNGPNTFEHVLNPTTSETASTPLYVTFYYDLKFLKLTSLLEKYSSSGKSQYIELFLDLFSSSVYQ